MKPTLVVTTDLTKEFNAAIARFRKDSVLIGIPANENQRDQDTEKGQEPGNAFILAINHFGVEEAHIPPRPVLSTGIKNAREPIAEQFKIMATKVLSAGPQALTTYYERAGTIAANACKKVINDQEGLTPPSAATLKARQYLTQSGFKGTKSLLVTAQLRNSITYVVKSIWGRG